MIDKLNFLQIYFIFARFCKFQKLFQKETAKESANRRDVNEGKFVLNIDCVMALKPDGLCVYETTIKTRQHIISVYL
jgi:hypothetical protein